MCMNGASIGMEIIAAPSNAIPQVPIAGPTACTVAVVGSAFRETVASRFVSATPLRMVAIASASASPSKFAVFFLWSRNPFSSASWGGGFKKKSAEMEKNSPFSLIFVLSFRVLPRRFGA